MSRASKPAKQNGTSSAETIRASGQRPREQAGHKTAPDQHARPSQTPCNAGAIHTGQSAFGQTTSLKRHEWKLARCRKRTSCFAPIWTIHVHQRAWLEEPWFMAGVVEVLGMSNRVELPQRVVTPRHALGLAGFGLLGAAAGSLSQSTAWLATRLR